MATAKTATVPRRIPKGSHVPKLKARRMLDKEWANALGVSTLWFAGFGLPTVLVWAL